MSDCYWTKRYSPERLPPTPLDLKAPLKRGWRYKPKGVAPGFTRAGIGAVFTTAGKGRAARIDLVSGKAVWAEENGASLIASWRSDLLVYGYDGRLRGLDPRSGVASWEHECEAGSETSFVIDDLLVGNRSEHFHVFDLNAKRFLWKVAEFTTTALLSDGRVLIRADDDVTCFELRTGRVLWNRSGSEFGWKCWQMGFIWRDLFVVKIGEPLLLTAFEVKTGKTVWRADFPVQWCEPYDERAYGIEAKGAYKVLDLATGKVVFERAVENVPPPETPRKGLFVERDPDAWPWRGTLAAVSETHTFLVKQAGQLVVLKRDSGALEQVVEIEGMPASLPIIYENRLLLTDFNASVYCFEGAP